MDKRQTDKIWEHLRQHIHVTPNRCLCGAKVEWGGRYMSRHIEKILNRKNWFRP